MSQRAKTQSTSTSATSATGSAEIAADAYVFGYPLILMDVTRRLGTATAQPGGMRAPANQFAHMRAFPDATFTDVVTPNADTLYSSAWLDLAAEPIVLDVPDMADRYYLMPMLDAWTNVFASPGTRTTGNGSGSFAIVGPKWSGTLPPGLKPIKAPTNTVWIIGRTRANGKEDIAAVNAIQDRYTLTPLSVWAKQPRAPRDAGDTSADPLIDTKTPPVEQVAKMDAAAFFSRLNALMIANPPTVDDGPDLARFEALGIGPGKALDIKGLDPVLDAGMKLAQARLTAEAAKPHGIRVNGWETPPASMGRYGQDYLWRAVVAVVGLGANVPEDAIYPRATTDVSNEPLNGRNKYVVRFAEGALPPVKAFWSVTMYNAKQAFVDNPIGRFVVSDHDSLSFGDDGSLTLYVQHESPGRDRESNWLPAPADSFNLVLRLYWPTRAILDGEWRPPAIERLV
jgi:hypothetical protein